ncbi:hypothetical protein KKG48_01155 [Patescibacteria group bacterium]|nr:hypothetical protein [Patescibacteria group bacterium]MCG2694750.1 hypothetical protein [Candidatus Parcubacteria bacterium]
MIILLWIVAVLLSFVGVVGVTICFFIRPLHEAEVEGMKRNGKFEGEPGYMQDFRVARAEGELCDNTKLLKIFSFLACMGILLIVFLLTR